MAHPLAMARGGYYGASRGYHGHPWHGHPWPWHGPGDHDTHFLITSPSTINVLTEKSKRNNER